MPEKPAPPSDAEIDALVRATLSEDIGSGDLSAALLDSQCSVAARLVCRQAAILCGVKWAARAGELVSEHLALAWACQEGEWMQPNEVVCRLRGPARALLSVERSVINLLQTLSATATAAARYVRAVQGSGCRILDTRKTLPGMRLAQKYAVRVGGADNHRLGLYDGVLLKENHIAAAGGIKAALVAAQKCTHVDLIEIEVESLDQLKTALQAGARRIMLDNFDLETMRAAVHLTGGRAELEVSGGVNLANVRAIALTGVTYISVGAITKHINAVDFSLRLEKCD